MSKKAKETEKQRSEQLMKLQDLSTRERRKNTKREKAVEEFQNVREREKDKQGSGGIEVTGESENPRGRV